MNETIQSLQNRIQSIENDVKGICEHQKPPKHEESRCGGLLSTPSQWSLSWTPRGLRIDTDIVSLQNLYEILSSGIVPFEMPDDTSSQSSNSTDTATVLKKKELWKSRVKAFPLYSSWETTQPVIEPAGQPEVCTKETMDEMMQIYSNCFLCLPCAHPTASIAERYRQGRLDPLLSSAIFGWTARHAAIFHNLFPGRDPNQVSQPFFLRAKELLKERFAQTSVDTMHSLLVMYIYAIGIPKLESEAYIYLGLAIRMCLDLKMNHEHPQAKTDGVERETHRRYFWALYFLETLGTVHADKPFSLPATFSVDFPQVLKHETGETRFRVEFMSHRFKITRIYRRMIATASEEKPLLVHVTAIDRELKAWYGQLPDYFHYQPGDHLKRAWDTGSFREQACVKLNFEYHFSLCQLYDLFYSKCPSQGSSIELISQETCFQSAGTMIELLECWVGLKQNWCHFSLESLMMVSMIYSHFILSQENEAHYRQTAQTHLERLLYLLKTSPVHHHTPVLSLIRHIQTILKDSLPPTTTTTTTTTTATVLPMTLPGLEQQENPFADFVYAPTMMDYFSHYQPSLPPPPSWLPPPPTFYPTFSEPPSDPRFY
ncbi:hypothetical protein BY458DRAFT_519682 [Sporodiniella umbellata]|nr:hypothetical protein BY458DRAFT_519682 [Sporodiniella umbellata]